MKEKRQYIRLCSIVVVLCLITGCGPNNKKVTIIDHDTYEKMTYDTVEVMRGDLEPSMSLTLSTDSYEMIQYGTNNQELELDKVYVSVGDKVKKGQQLVTFKSESIQKIIDDNKQQYDSNAQLVEHYEKLMKIDSSLDYSEDIKQLKEDMAVESLYISEAKAKLKDYQLVAQKDGTIVAMDELIMNGHMNYGNNLVSEACGSGKYKTARPKENIFAVGQTYIAMSDDMEFPMKVSKITDEDIIFTPQADMSALSETESLSMVIKKKKLVDVVYVNAEAISQHNGREYVFSVDIDGYRKAVKVKLGDKVGDNVVIKEGLSGGEKVTVN